MTSTVDLCCGSPPQRRSTLGRMSRGDGRGRSFLSPSQQRTDLNDDILDMDLLSDTVPARNMPDASSLLETLGITGIQYHEWLAVHIKFRRSVVCPF
jgi:hypothetical protein